MKRVVFLIKKNIEDKKSHMLIFKSEYHDKLLRVLAQTQLICHSPRNNFPGSCCWRVCLLYLYNLPHHDHTFGHREQEKEGGRNRNKAEKRNRDERPRAPVPLCSTCTYTQWEWWPRVLTAFSSWFHSHLKPPSVSAYLF